MQGYGLFMMEQLIHSPDGVLFTRGPGATLAAYGPISLDVDHLKKKKRQIY